MPVDDGIKERAHAAALLTRIESPQLHRTAINSLQASFPQANYLTGS
jgi:hypothetical protein